MTPTTLGVMTLAMMTAVTVAGASARAGDGVWVGREKGVDANVVVLERRGDAIVLSDDAGVRITRATFVVAGPGGKGGALSYDVDLVTQLAATRVGAPMPGQRKGAKQLARWREDVEAGTIDMCLSTGKKQVRPPRATEVMQDVRCFTLARVNVPAWGVDVPAPGAPTPECMRECRQANMMRAVSPEAIDEDCRKTCGAK
ncbi:MAG: hypothetical protein IT385_16465 [Deltaproteobacteria bacterium]|nr:hypothetical protein [Deltaproteobacteria bacterium]